MASGLDFSIPGQAFANQYNPAETLGQQFRLKALMQQQQLQEQQAAAAQEELAYRREDRARASSLREALAGAYNQETGALDPNRAQQAYAQAGDLEGLTAFQKSQRDEQAARIKSALEQTEVIGRLAGSAVDQASYDRARMQAQALGLDVSGLPAQFNPQTVRGIQMQALDAKGQLEQQWKGLDHSLKLAEFGYRQQNDAAQRAVQLRGQDMSRGNAMIAAQARPMTVSEQIKVAEFQQAQQDKAQAKAGAADSFDMAMGTLSRLTTHKGMSAAVGLKGFSGGLLGGVVVPGTEAANFITELEAFKSQMFLPMVLQLKGMGALSNAEGQKLTAAVGALDHSMTEAEFKASATRIMGDLQRARARVGGAPATGGNQAPPLLQKPAGNGLRSKYGLE